MGFKERIISIRLIEKEHRRPEVFKEIGVVVNTNHSIKDDITDEKIVISKKELSGSAFGLQ